MHYWADIIHSTHEILEILSKTLKIQQVFPLPNGNKKHQSRAEQKENRKQKWNSLASLRSVICVRERACYDFKRTSYLFFEKTRQEKKKKILTPFCRPTEWQLSSGEIPIISFGKDELRWQ